MIRQRIALAIGRSKNRQHYEFLYRIAKDIAVGVSRFSTEDERRLLSYLDWLQQYEMAHRVMLHEKPYSMMTNLDSWAQAFLSSVRIVLGIPKQLVPTWIKSLIKRTYRIVRATLGKIKQGVAAALAAICLALVYFAKQPLRWLRSRMRVRRLYLYSRRTAFELLTKNGDLEGAIEAFTRLSKLSSRPERSYAALDRLMLHLLPSVAQIEGAIASEKFPEPSPLRERLVISVVLWGERYIQLFEEYCLPSLLAAGNIPALRRNVTIYWHVFTTVEGRERLAKGDFGTRLAGTCQIRYEEIPADLIKMAGGDRRYWLYGALSNTSFRLAARLGADIHFLNPDVVYSKDFLSSLYRTVRKKDARIILSNSFRTTRDSVCPALDQLRATDGTISLEVGTLHGLGLRHIHPSSREFFLRASEVEAGIAPRATVFFWLEEDAVVCHTAHYTPIFVSNLLLNPQIKLPYFTVDSSILRILGRQNDLRPVTHIVQPEDRIGYFEISPRSMFRADKTTLDRLSEIFWETNTHAELGLLGRELRLPLDPQTALGHLTMEGPSSSRSAFLHILKSIEAKAPSIDLDKVAAMDETRSYSILDLVRRTDFLVGFEVRNGCIPETEIMIEDVREIVLHGEIDYAASRGEVNALGRLWVNFLRLGLFDALLTLVERHRLPLPAAREKFMNFCKAAFPACQQRGEAYRAKYPDSEIFVMGCIVWGDEYIDNFMRYNIRSMLASGNLPALAKQGQLVFNIVTNAAGKRRIYEDPIFVELSALAEIEFLIVPDELIEMLIAGHLADIFYILYGMLDHCSIFLAQGMGAHLFMIPVDAIVADGSLNNMANYRHDGYECCGGGNIVAETETFLPALDEQHGKDRVISIGTDELATLAAQHAHHYFKSQIVAAENKDFGKHPRELFWPVDGGVEIHSVFIHPLFTSASGLARYKRMHFANIDYGMIPRMFSDSSRIKIIEDPRQAYINNFASSRRSYETTTKPFTVRDFLKAHDYSYPVQKSLFYRAQFLPCRLSGWTAYREVAKDVTEICNALEGVEEPVIAQAAVA